MGVGSPGEEGDMKDTMRKEEIHKRREEKEWISMTCQSDDFLGCVSCVDSEWDHLRRDFPMAHSASPGKTGRS